MNMESKNIFFKAILVIISVGVWALVLQNAGVIGKANNVYVSGGYIDNVNNIRGSVDVNVQGGVTVDNTVDINIQAINGHRNVFFNNSARGEYNKYYRLPVTPN